MNYLLSKKEERSEKKPHCVKILKIMHLSVQVEKNGSK